MSDVIGFALLALVIHGLFLAWREDGRRHKRNARDAARWKSEFDRQIAMARPFAEASQKAWEALQKEAKK